jgi:hypothetical protein
MDRAQVIREVLSAAIHESAFLPVARANHAPTTATAIIEAASDHGALLYRRGDRIVARPPGLVPDELRERIREHKAELLPLLPAAPGGCDGPPDRPLAKEGFEGTARWVFRLRRIVDAPGQPSSLLLWLYAFGLEVYRFGDRVHFYETDGPVSPYIWEAIACCIKELRTLLPDCEDRRGLIALLRAAEHRGDKFVAGYALDGLRKNGGSVGHGSAD